MVGTYWLGLATVGTTVGGAVETYWLVVAVVVAYWPGPVVAVRPWGLVVGAVLGGAVFVSLLWSSDWMTTLGSVYVNFCACGSFWRPYSTAPINPMETRNTMKSDGSRSTGGM